MDPTPSSKKEGPRDVFGRHCQGALASRRSARDTVLRRGSALRRSRNVGGVDGSSGWRPTLRMRSRRVVGSSKEGRRRGARAAKSQRASKKAWSRWR